MTHQKNRVVVPDWISCHTYLFGQAESRTYISNEMRHTYILLEGLASDLWKLLSDGIDDEELSFWARRHGVSDQIAPFLEQLAEQKLIVYNNEKKGDNAIAFSYDELSKNSSSEQEGKFIQEMQSWLFEKNFMYSLFIELTYQCNLRCVHCYNPKNMPGDELDFEQCKRVIDDAYDLGCFRVTFSGGEATLHSKFLELVIYARSKRMSVEIFTNGQVLAVDDELYNNLLRQYPYRIGVSLYSTDEKTHEKVTAVDGSFEKTMHLIKKLRNDNVNVQIKNFLLNFNCNDCIDVKQFAKEIGAMSVADISRIPTIEGDKKTLRYTLNADDLFWLYTDSVSPFYVGKGYVEFDYEKRKHDAPCLGGFVGLCITPFGDVTVCVSMPMSLGNLKSTTLKRIWYDAADKKSDSKLYKWRKITVADYSECHKEEYCKFCSFCPGMGYLENGFLKKSDVLCAQAKAKMGAIDCLKIIEK